MAAPPELAATSAEPAEATVSAMDPTADAEQRVMFFFAGQQVMLRRRFRRVRFLRLLNEDPAAALLEALGPAEYARVEDLEMDDEEFLELLETLAQRLTGRPLGNSSPSPR